MGIPKTSVSALETVIELGKGSLTARSNAHLEVSLRGISRGLSCSLGPSKANYRAHASIHVLFAPEGVHLYEV